ncbi:unnamed protein product [Chrysodeixis includens]|uniref:Uncharacterized protein n=1 Tax=Chrysodeixis includens TaxID=689277 RepID=A0A9P0C0S1_CHRIL|nr:unnamed protein product [Chrysodeixis includens]
MTRRKSVCLKWTLVLLVVLVCPSVYTRPQENSPIATTIGVQNKKSTQAPIREADKAAADQPAQSTTSPSDNSSRDVKSKTPIRDSIEMVAIQLLDKPNTTSEAPVIADSRIPPKVKVQFKHKIRRNENGEDLENAHPGVAVPVTMDELDTENKINQTPSESSTSNEGISTWISLSHNVKENSTTESSKVEEITKKPKPAPSKNKPKRPQNNKISKRPIIGSTNKADLVASGSAINENVYNKIKDTVLSNVQKNKNTSARPSSTTTTTTTTTTTEEPTTKKETKAPAIVPVITVTSKPKKKNKNKQKVSTTLAPPVIDDSALLPTEAKEQEIELEVSTPATTTKKPKRNSTRKKNKTKKRKTATAKPITDVALTEDVASPNKTKSNKNAKKPAAETGAITTQIYNYLSREVMPSVGVGMIGLASLVGIAGYFLYPFATPVRRTFEVDKSDDLYRNNAEEYANDGNGQAEEEMLGTVLAGMPAHAKQKLNPYAAQTAHINRYPVKKDQDIRYRHVATAYSPNPNYGKVHYAQQKTGIAHAAVYSKPINYSPHYETRHVYTTEGKYNYEKPHQPQQPHQPNYTPSFPAVEPIYAAPQTGPSGISSYGNDNSNSVVYGVKPASETDFKPVYPFEGQFYSETTSSSVTYPPTSMYLGSNDEAENQNDSKFDENTSGGSEAADNKFVVGNVPKELSDSATPAVVPEHGPRKLRKKRSISGSLEELLAEKGNKDIFISNEIDDVYNMNTPIRNLAPNSPDDVTVLPKDITTIFAISEPNKESQTNEPATTPKIEIVESVSTLPINNKDEKTTDGENDTETTTKTFKVYEVFPSSDGSVTERNSPLSQTTTFKSMMTETTTEGKSETTSIMPTSVPISTVKPSPTTRPLDEPEVITYPPDNQQGSFFTFLQRLVDFKFRLGLGILQTTVDALNRLRNDTMERVATASNPQKG